MLAAVVHARRLARAAHVPGPGPRVLAVDDQSGVGASLLDHAARQVAVALVGPLRVPGEGVAPPAPARAEHPVMPLDQAREPRPGVAEAFEGLREPEQTMKVVRDLGQRQPLSSTPPGTSASGSYGVRV